MEYKIVNRAFYDSPNNFNGHNVISGICPFCNQSSGFKISGIKSGHTVPLKCDNCDKNVIWDYEDGIMLPGAKLNSLIGLPDDINNYYQEALSCISVQAPNGAATLFRKLIHQVGIHYDVAKINDNTSLMGIVEKLEKDGHINNKLVEALRRVKDLGNDGAHVNENEPSMEQIYVIKKLIDSFLQATVLQDVNIEMYDKSKADNGEEPQ